MIPSLSLEKWRGYPLSWCELCDGAVITCETCKNSSCNGSGCPVCIKDFVEFGKVSIKLIDCLDVEEAKAYEKARRLKKLIILSAHRGDTEIDWRGLLREGHLSEMDKLVFYRELDF
jgi:hypothetical protein